MLSRHSYLFAKCKMSSGPYEHIFLQVVWEILVLVNCRVLEIHLMYRVSMFYVQGLYLQKVYNYVGNVPSMYSQREMTVPYL